MPIRYNPKTLTTRADLEDRAADRAADIARHAEALGHFDGAETLWRTARRCRVESLKLRALAAAREVRGWR